MNTKTLLVLAIASILILNACSSSFLVASSSASQSTPVVESIPGTGYQPTDVVEAGVASLIPFHLTYIGADGNVWYYPGAGGQPEQITTDASGTPSGSNANPSISYYFPQISSDGEWIAYRREVGTPAISGNQFSYGLWVQNRKTGESQIVLEEFPASFAWKPETHLLAYSLSYPDNYFSFSGVVPDNFSPARSVMGFDADTGRTGELVQSERGYALYRIQWSPDGRYLGFDEVVYIEGRGLFGYYDFESGTYFAWEEAIGNYAWALRGSQVIYDRLTYVAVGTENLFSRPLGDGGEKRITDYTAESEYAFYPAVSPLGDRVAYLTNLEGPESQNYTLNVQELGGGEVVSLGTFVSANYLAWSPDGKSLLFSAGPWGEEELFSVDVSNGAATVLGSGTMLDLAGD